jgi:hypothetical protein
MKLKSPIEYGHFTNTKEAIEQRMDVTAMLPCSWSCNSEFSKGITYGGNPRRAFQ